VIWGSGDFAGGLAARRSHQFQVLAVSALSGVVMLLLCGAVRHESWPPASSLAWAAAAGVSGAGGIASLYRGLAIGSAAIVAPTAAVITAALPVMFSALTVGLPQPSQFAGFIVAIAGIWLVARTGGSSTSSNDGLRLAIAAGVGFGGFLILIAQVHSEFVFLPLAVTRTMTLVAALGLLLMRGMAMPALTANPVALVAGVLDAGGNVLFLFARQYTRFDIAAVLSSFYPVATVVLARVILRERVTALQWLGAGVCLAAVALITA
jgi:drug/metabolite transporter (DMT)-like permease